MLKYYRVLNDLQMRSTPSHGGYAGSNPGWDHHSFLRVLIFIGVSFPRVVFSGNPFHKRV